MHSLAIYDHFGDSKLLKIPAFEYFGDLYASPKLNDIHDQRILSKNKMWGSLNN